MSLVTAVVDRVGECHRSGHAWALEGVDIEHEQEVWVCTECATISRGGSGE